MNKKREKIVALVLTWAGLFMLILYSPIGSPDLYIKQKYLSEKGNAVFYNVEENMSSLSRRAATRSQFSEGAQSTPFPTTESGTSTNYAVASSQQVKSQQMTETNIVFNQNEIVQNRGSRDMMGNGYVGSTSIKRNSKKNNLGDNDVISITTDLTALNNTIKYRQGIGYNPNSGGTSPGEDPIGDPIPIGDGWIYLSFLVLGYTVWKVVKPRLL